MATASTSLRPIVFCGPSGVGKGTLIELLMKRFPNDQFGFSVSHTTRGPREGEQNGVHYHFTTVPEIEKEIAADKFIEYAEVHGRYYGTRYVQEVVGWYIDKGVREISSEPRGSRNVRHNFAHFFILLFESFPT